MTRKTVTVALVGSIVALGAITANAGVNDSWITTKVKIALLTADGFSVHSVGIDTVHGNVTIHGKVATAEDRARAEKTVRDVKGVKTVKDLLQVIPSNLQSQVTANDSEIKDRVEASLKTDRTIEDVKVASVDNGVVLLSGKTDSLADKLRAIENAYSVNGVQRVSSEITTVEN
jgi:hyperosmotically inducible periplasmic protein